jgi:hypothetical protein
MKVVPSKNWTTFVLEDVECLGEIWRTRQKFRRSFDDIRVLVGFDRAFDQGLTTRGF